MTKNLTDNRRRLVISAAALGIAFVALYLLFPYSTGYGAARKTVGNWLRQFWSYPDWQHGMLVPLVIGFVLFKTRDKWIDLPVRGSWWGAPVVLVSAFLFWVGYKANVQYFGFMSAHSLCIGAVLWLFGWAHLRAFAFPLLFLGFMWPLIFMEGIIAFPLRMIMCELSSGFLNFIGLDNLRVGSAIVSASDPAAGLAQSERFALDIESPCSGLRSLFALMMVSAIFGFFTLPSSWQRWFLFVASVPLAIAGNFVRICLLVFGTLFFGSEFAIGKDGGTSSFHFLAGIAVFVVALGGMLLIASLLRGGPMKLWRELRGGTVSRRQVTLPPSSSKPQPSAS